ncbi:TetR/AcrR family transcriptional regulator [Halopenitus persicus]|uniref:Transcriptional regulator, TetR family n=1 Tax=Halopenitus persicus TaxID=1048396 RepID=A0A1H3MAX0_9EURY|nr:TetR/AcrR family transcriptional regulator [Halopenitus persicus]QHS16540.1 TetR/AcrR family transcriptional regulator [haloarchaeon 3A1-DGR]SDY73841.1 transcriptional regulator, TetR family [Halopenitus persicus]
MDDDPATEILEATYRALCRHGYADLTIKDIAAEADRSTASVHYYFDDKQTLFVEFLEYLYDRYTAQLAAIDGDTARDRLAALLETVLADDETGTGLEFRTAMLEVTAQAPYDDAIRARLAAFDDVLFDRIRAIIEDGIDRGEFDATVDPTVATEFLVTAVSGAYTRQVAMDRSPEQLRATMTRYVETRLLAE